MTADRHVARRAVARLAFVILSVVAALTLTAGPAVADSGSLAGTRAAASNHDDGEGVGASSDVGPGQGRKMAADSYDPALGCCIATRAACSFSGATLVLMANGTRIPISEVKEGDYVYATDPETGETGAREVLATLPHTDQFLTLRTSSGEIVTTEDHRYWNETNQAWQESKDIDEGDRLLSADGDEVTVEGLDWTTVHTAAAYDLTIDDLHTFYAATGEDEVLVHNCGDLGADWLQRTTSQIYRSTDCGACARNIATRLGLDPSDLSNYRTLNPRSRGGSLGGYRGVADSGWDQHTVVVSNGRVYDAFGPRSGMPIDEWKRLWTNAGQIDFGF